MCCFYVLPPVHLSNSLSVRASLVFAPVPECLLVTSWLLKGEIWLKTDLYPAEFRAKVQVLALPVRLSHMSTAFHTPRGRLAVTGSSEGVKPGGRSSMTSDPCSVVPANSITHPGRQSVLRNYSLKPSTELCEFSSAALRLIKERLQTGSSS